MGNSPAANSNAWRWRWCWITRPAVLFGDEPTGALDTATSRQVLVMLRELVDRERQTIVMVTHDPVAAALECGPGGLPGRRAGGGAPT